MEGSVVFRVDASFEIGTGHVMRCINLAKGFSKHGVTCIFISRSQAGDMNEFIRSNGYCVYALEGTMQDNAQVKSVTNNSYGHWVMEDWRNDANQTKEVIAKLSCSWMVVDHYGIDSKWELAIKPYCKYLCIIDDLVNRKHDCNVLIDQNLIGLENLDCYDKLVSEECFKLLGTKYAILNDAYYSKRHLAKCRTGRIKRVLVFFGGSDSKNQTSKALKALSENDFKDIEVDVVVGVNSPYYEIIDKLVTARPKTYIFTNLPDLSEKMISADLMIGGGGTTAWERMCLGLPAIVLSIAENQTSICQSLDEAGLINFLGVESNVEERDITKAINDALHDPEKLRKQSEEMMQLVDGMGVERIIQAMNLVESA